MPSLDEIIRAVAAKGELNYLSMTPPDRDGGEFEAVYSPATGWSHNIVRHKDPVEAIARAITEYKKPRAKRTTKPETESTEFG